LTYRRTPGPLERAVLDVVATAGAALAVAEVQKKTIGIAGIHDGDDHTVFGLALFLGVVPHRGGSRVDGAGGMVLVICGTLLLLAVLGVARRSPDRVRSVLLAAGAGTAFGVVAVLVRSLMVLLGQSRPGAILAAAIGIGVLVGQGYLMLQHAYRSGHFAASLATAVVIDPPAAIIAGALFLHEPLPVDTLRLLLVLAAAAVVTTGIAVLVRSPAHVLTLPIPMAGDGLAELEGTCSIGR
jgi:hypothetical protein